MFSPGANPNKTTSHGKTCLGEAASLGNVETLKLLITASKSLSMQNKTPCINTRKRSTKCHKRKLKHDEQNGDIVVKYKNFNEKKLKDCSNPVKNQGHFVFIHNDGSSSDESRFASLMSPVSPSSLTSSPQADLEWDEDIGNVAPSTSEDETWTALYKFVLIYFYIYNKLAITHSLHWIY